MATKLTREQFERKLNGGDYDVHLRGPIEICPCDCGDVNCHGWRVVAKGIR